MREPVPLAETVAIRIVVYITKLEPGERWTFDPRDLRLPEDVLSCARQSSGVEDDRETLSRVAASWDQVLEILSRFEMRFPDSPGERTIECKTVQAYLDLATRTIVTCRVRREASGGFSVEGIDRRSEPANLREVMAGLVTVCRREDLDRLRAGPGPGASVEEIEGFLDEASGLRLFGEALERVAEDWAPSAAELGLDLLGTFARGGSVECEGPRLGELEREVDRLDRCWREMGRSPAEVPELFGGLDAVRRAVAFARERDAVLLLE